MALALLFPLEQLTHSLIHALISFLPYPPIYYINVSKIPECKHLIEAGKKRGLMIMAVVPKPNDGSKGLVEFYPTAEALLEVGMDQVYEPPHGSKFDVVECAVSYYVVGDAICSPRPPMPFPTLQIISPYATNYYHHHTRTHANNIDGYTI